MFMIKILGEVFKLPFNRLYINTFICTSTNT